MVSNKSHSMKDKYFSRTVTTDGGDGVCAYVRARLHGNSLKFSIFLFASGVSSSVVAAFAFHLVKSNPH